MLEHILTQSYEQTLFRISVRTSNEPSNIEVTVTLNALMSDNKELKFTNSFMIEQTLGLTLVVHATMTSLITQFSINSY